MESSKFLDESLKCATHKDKVIINIFPHCNLLRVVKNIEQFIAFVYIRRSSPAKWKLIGLNFTLQFWCLQSCQHLYLYFLLNWPLTRPIDCCPWKQTGLSVWEKATFSNMAKITSDYRPSIVAGFTGFNASRKSPALAERPFFVR